MLFNLIQTLNQAIRECDTVPRFGFVQGHFYIPEARLKQIQKHVVRENEEAIKQFETNFSKIIGNGHSISFAAGRMGFYALLMHFNIGKEDEIILPGATCSVMVNAVLRAGATPVFADIDPVTFGSSAMYIESVITPHTRMIVAQHSFGIPCEIQPIVELAKKRGIFLVEDCALTVGSSINGIVCGNFGDAAIFSTDHSKPINTITGGLVYTKDRELYQGLKKIQEQSGSFSDEKKWALWERFLFERQYYKPERDGRVKIIKKLRKKS